MGDLNNIQLDGGDRDPPLKLITSMIKHIDRDWNPIVLNWIQLYPIVYQGYP